MSASLLPIDLATSKIASAIIACGEGFGGLAPLLLKLVSRGNSPARTQ